LSGDPLAGAAVQKPPLGLGPAPGAGERKRRSASDCEAARLDVFGQAVEHEGPLLQPSRWMSGGQRIGRNASALDDDSDRLNRIRMIEAISRTAAGYGSTITLADSLLHDNGSDDTAGIRVAE
jgi:hypothetical protein